MNIKRDFTIVIAFMALILSYAFCTEANAQTTQPVYTRPSKGAVLQTFSGTVSATIVTSPTFDWTAFSAATISARFANASGNRCSCPSGVDNCLASFTIGYKTSTSKTGPFGDVLNSTVPFPLMYNPSAPVTDPLVNSLGVYNINDPYVQFFSAFTAYVDTGTGLPVTGCFLTITITPIPFTSRVVAEGPASGGADSGTVSPVLPGGFDYIPLGGSGSIYSIHANRVNSTGVVAVGHGSGNPILPATTPVAVNAATLVYTASVNQRGVRLQNVGANPALCAAGASAASVAAGRYSFALAAAATVGAGGSFVVEQLDTSNSAANGKVYCLGSGGATSIAIMPF